MKLRSAPRIASVSGPNRDARQFIPGWRQRKRQRKTALVRIVISTPVQEEITTASIAEHLRDNAELAHERARALGNLDTMGWTLLRRPSVVWTETYYQDFIAYWRKDFDDDGEAYLEMLAAGAFEDLDFSLLWGHDDTRSDGASGPHHEWGKDGPPRPRR